DTHLTYDVCLYTTPRPPRPALFPYTTLFRSQVRHAERPIVQSVPRASRLAPDHAAMIGAHRARESDVSEGAEDLEQVHAAAGRGDRKSTRLNSSHVAISYAVFCLKKKKRAAL